MKLNIENISRFQELVLSFYLLNRRDFPWRYNDAPYRVFISEIMLQQTQTFRVIEKYQQFLARFPTVHDVAQASFQEVLQYWMGLGYNRRALNLHKACQIVSGEHQGKFPDVPEKLKELPGIGPYTAGAICTFAYNQPQVFIETNIRAVFIFTFFSNAKIVSDKEIMPLIEQTLDQKNPREWYYALMDYGVYLKKTYANPARASAHYAKQSTFKDSDRQIRAAILRHVLSKGSLSRSDTIKLFPECEEQRIASIIDCLIQEQFLKIDNSMLSISHEKI